MVKVRVCASFFILISFLLSIDVLAQPFVITGDTLEAITLEQIQEWGFTVQVSEPDAEGFTHVRVYLPNDINGRLYTNTNVWLKGSGGQRILSFRPKAQLDSSSQSLYVELVGEMSTLVCMRVSASFTLPPDPNDFSTSHGGSSTVALEIHGYLDMENLDCNVPLLQAVRSRMRDELSIR